MTDRMQTESTAILATAERQSIDLLVDWISAAKAETKTKVKYNRVTGKAAQDKDYIDNKIINWVTID